MSHFKTIGKYTVEGQLGQGRFGNVYRGLDPDLRREVAIKVCSVDDEGLRKRFLREAEIAGNLQHRNIVTVYDFGYEQEIPYLVQELLPGEDLRAVIKRRPPPPPAEKINYLLQVAEGLAYAHSQGVIHRDVKPGNVRWLPDGTVKIVDFGIAKLASAETQLTQKGVTMGTASYLPPEQVRGTEADHRADVFSFGVLAYELLSHERPFRGNTLSALVYQILYKVPQPMTAVWPECPQELSDLVARCLEKKPERRWASFEELIPHLTAVGEGIRAGRWPALLVLPSLPATPPPTPPPVPPAPARDEAPTAILPIAAVAGEAAGEGDLEPLETAETIKMDRVPTPPPVPRREPVAEPPRAEPPPLAPPPPPAAPEEVAEVTEVLHAELPPLPPEVPPPAPPEAAPPSPPPEVVPEAPPAEALRAELPLLAPEAPLEAAPLEGGPEAPAARGREIFSGRKGWLWAGAAALLVIVVAAGWMLLRGGPEPPPEVAAPPPPPPPADQPSAPAPTLGAVNVTALPWARVTEITDGDGYLKRPPDDPHTPLHLELPVGRYNLTLENADGSLHHNCEVEITTDVVAVCAAEFPPPPVIEYFKESGWWK